MNKFKEIDVLSINESNAFKLVGKDWMLIIICLRQMMVGLLISIGMLAVIGNNDRKSVW